MSEDLEDDSTINMTEQACCDGAHLMEEYEADTYERRFLALFAAIAFELVTSQSTPECVTGLLDRMPAAIRDFMDIYKDVILDEADGGVDERDMS